MKAFALALLLCLPLSVPLHAQERRVIEATDLAPGVSLRPELRPGGAPVRVAPEAVGIAPTAPVVTEAPTPRRPRLLAGLFRPRGGAANAAVVSGGGSALATVRSLRPQMRPDGLEARVRAAATRNLPAAVAQPGRTTGRLCGVRGLQGDQIAPVTGRISGCGIPDAVLLRVVHGVRLTQPATINCNTAQALSQWLLSANDIVGNTGGGIANLRVVASYSCRTRNSQSGARLSEHAVGNAIDIAGIGLANGTELSVLNDWRSNRSQIMRNLHQAACGPFGTVLGPNSDRFHQDHFHFDVASYRSGSYCR